MASLSFSVFSFGLLYLAYMFSRYTDCPCKNPNKPLDAGYCLTEIMFHILASSHSFLVPAQKPLLQEVVAFSVGRNSVSCCKRGSDTEEENCPVFQLDSNVVPIETEVMRQVCSDFQVERCIVFHFIFKCLKLKQNRLFHRHPVLSTPDNQGSYLPVRTIQHIKYILAS